jgi:hypothetical protein
MMGAFDHPSAQRGRGRRVWFEWNRAEDNRHVLIGPEDDFLSADGTPKPGKRDEAPRI